MKALIMWKPNIQKISAKFCQDLFHVYNSMTTALVDGHISAGFYYHINIFFSTTKWQKNDDWWFLFDSKYLGYFQSDIKWFIVNLFRTRNYNNFLKHIPFHFSTGNSKSSNVWSYGKETGSSVGSAYWARYGCDKACSAVILLSASISNIFWSKSMAAIIKLDHLGLHFTWYAQENKYFFFLFCNHFLFYVS